MNRHTAARAAYAQEIERLARALAEARDDEVHNAIADEATPFQVELFVDGNLHKRADLLQKQLDFLAGAFDNLQELLAEFVEVRPMAALDTPSEDGERFLRWLIRAKKPTPVQRDHIACQRGRHAVERAGRTNRSAHLRFQELWSLAPQLAKELDANPDLKVHLNPLRASNRFATDALLGAGASVPATVLFFAVREGVSTAVLDLRGRRLLAELARLAPCTVAEWAIRSRRSGRTELATFCRSLAEMGLVAFS